MKLPADKKVRRSLLFTPAFDARDKYKDDPLHMIRKAIESNADVIILDLEDSIKPENKALARQMLAMALGKYDFGDKEVVIRVNGFAGSMRYKNDQGNWVKANNARWLGEDVGALNELKLANPEAYKKISGVLLSKTESNADVRALEAAWKDNTKSIWLLCETRKGIKNAGVFAKGHPRVKALMFGNNDMAAEAGISDPDDHASLMNYERPVLDAARENNLMVFDGPSPQLAKTHYSYDLFETATRASRRLGFDGKACIKPNVTSDINKIFSPVRREYTEAMMEIAKYNQGVQDSGNAAVDTGQNMGESLHTQVYQDIIDVYRALVRQGKIRDENVNVDVEAMMGQGMFSRPDVLRGGKPRPISPGRVNPDSSLGPAI